MKVVIITLVNQGGMSHYTSQLANSLSNYVDVHVIVGNKVERNLFNKDISLYLVDLYPFETFNNKYFGFKSVINILNKIKPDIIHISGNHYWIFGLYLYLKKKNVVLTLHDVNEHLGEISFTTKLISKLHFKLARHIFVHGEKLKNSLIMKGYPKENISVIKHGDYSFFKKYILNNIQEDGSVLFFGRILDYKGLEYLIKAVPLIKKQIPDINIIIAGNGNFIKYASLITSPNNFEIINKFIPDERVAELFQRASVVVLPYIEGSQTGIIPIAYSFKKPVIATNVGSISEVIENGVTGYIVPPKNSDLLANSIVKILKDNVLRKQMGENAYKLMKEELSWDLIAEKTIQVYEYVMESSYEN